MQTIPAMQPLTQKNINELYRSLRQCIEGLVVHEIWDQIFETQELTRHSFKNLSHFFGQVSQLTDELFAQMTPIIKEGVSQILRKFPEQPADFDGHMVYSEEFINFFNSLVTSLYNRFILDYGPLDIVKSGYIRDRHEQMKTTEEVLDIIVDMQLNVCRG